jgi:hypothetical protein
MIWAGEVSLADAAGLGCAHPAAPTRAATTDTPTLFHVVIAGSGFCAPRRTPAVHESKAKLRKAHEPVAFALSDDATPALEGRGPGLPSA